MTLPDFSSWTGYQVTDRVFYGGAGGGGDANAIANSMEGLVGSDATVQFGNPLDMVCLTSIRGMPFPNPEMDGILGVSAAPTSFLHQLVQAGKLPQPHMALCFSDYNNNNDDGGVVTLGGYNAQFMDTPLVHAQATTGTHSHQVLLVNLFLRPNGGMTMATDNNNNYNNANSWIPVNLDSSSTTTTSTTTPMTIDSTTPFLTLPVSYEQAFRVAWHEATQREYTPARQALTVEELEKLPTLVLELQVSCCSLERACVLCVLFSSSSRPDSFVSLLVLVLFFCLCRVHLVYLESWIPTRYPPYRRPTTCWWPYRPCGTWSLWHPTIVCFGHVCCLSMQQEQQEEAQQQRTRVFWVGVSCGATRSSLNSIKPGLVLPNPVFVVNLLAAALATAEETVVVVVVPTAHKTQRFEAPTTICLRHHRRHRRRPLPVQLLSVPPTNWLLVVVVPAILRLVEPLWPLDTY